MKGEDSWSDAEERHTKNKKGKGKGGFLLLPPLSYLSVLMLLGISDSKVPGASKRKPSASTRVTRSVSASKSSSSKRRRQSGMLSSVIVLQVCILIAH